MVTRHEIAHLFSPIVSTCQVNLDGCCQVSDVGLARLLSVLPADCHLSVIGTAVCRLSAARDKKVRTGAGSVFPLDEGYYYVENLTVCIGRRLLETKNSEK